jgi:hypothetical protein
MAASNLDKYVIPALTTGPIPHPEVTQPRLMLKSDASFGNKNFLMIWWPITEPFVMVSEHHKHDFDQFFCFAGGDANNLTELGGEVEFTLSEDGKNLKTFLITKATIVHVPAGVYHCPLNFKKVNNPKKPMLFQDLTFTLFDYKRVAPQP